MAGGNFDINTPKVRPGNYINYKAKKNIAPTSATRGVCVIPLVGYDWGPDGAILELTPSAPDAAIETFGRSIYADNDHMILIRLALYNASLVKVYIISGGKKASGQVPLNEGALTVTAMYGGTRGNAITISSVENTDGGFDISLYLDGELMEHITAVSTVEDLIARGSSYVTYSGSGELKAFAGVTLSNGENEASTNTAFTAFLDKIERISCNTVSIPVKDTSLLVAAASKVEYLRTNSGKTVQFVVPKHEANNIGVINVCNSFTFDGKELSVAQATAWVAGATAGADKIKSNTYMKVQDATAVVDELSNEATIEAIKAGKFIFSSDDKGNVIVEYDINSLVNPSNDQNDSYKKNRVIRVFDSFADDLKITFPPNRFNNSEEGWSLMEGFGKSLLQNYLDDGAIINVDFDTDFLVDRSRSAGDSTYFNVALQPVDSAEKLYFSISTQ